jgi:hypothetical protein
MMFSLSRMFVAAGALVALTAASTPGYSDGLAFNMGPVGPHEPILTTVGSKRVIAFFEPGGDGCAVHVVVWNLADVSGGSAARVRTSLSPRQIVHIDSGENKSLSLQCNESAAALTIIKSGGRIALGSK